MKKEQKNVQDPQPTNFFRFRLRYPCLNLPIEELKYVRRPGMYLCPHRETIHESLAESWPVSSRAEARYFLPELLKQNGIRPFEPSELIFKPYCYDDRTDSTRELILTPRFFTTQYETPQVCGWFEIQHFRPDQKLFPNVTEDPV